MFPNQRLFLSLPTSFVEDELGLFQVYPEQLLSRLAKKAFGMLGCEADGFYEGMGGVFLQGCSDWWAPRLCEIG